jgi:class 3 adenylate cyclase
VLAKTRTAAQVFDHQGRLAWVSEELIRLAGTDADADVGLGTLPVDGDRPIWHKMLTEDSLEALVGELHRRVDPSSDWAPAWVGPVQLRVPGRRLTIGLLGVTLRGRDGSVLGSALIYAPLLPARVLALLAEGDAAVFDRLATLTTPGRRAAAVLFADIDSSGVLSRRMATGAYFELIRGVLTAFDDLVAEHGGITGKHAGDGASAYFLTEILGSESAAALAALSTARALPAAVREHLGRLEDCGYDIELDSCRLNIGVHWGANLYIGQVITGGRLEVTALGDEVTECARIEHVAIGGQTLASKAVVERLDPGAAAGLWLSPKRLRYRVLAELVRDDPKALRDAGSIAVADLTEWPGPTAEPPAPCP